MWLFNWKKTAKTFEKYPLEFYVFKFPVSEGMPAANFVLETSPFDETAKEFPSVAFALIERLLAGRQVLTEIDRSISLANTTKKRTPIWEGSLFRRTTTSSSAPTKWRTAPIFVSRIR